MLAETPHWFCFIAIAITTTTLSAIADAEGLAKRSVELTYTCTIEDIPSTAKTIDLWLPMAQDCDGQRVTRADVVWPENGSIALDPKYGNKIFHKRFEAPFDDDLHDGVLGAQLVFDIHRTEIVVSEAKGLDPAKRLNTRDKLAPYLTANALIPIDGRIESIALELGLKNDSPIIAARKIYDHLIDSMVYNYKAPGAGKGDVLWACDSKTGDCTDYHSMFIALCRNQGIPADHEFGYPIRSKDSSGKVSSYHCWARFYVEGVGWIPIDASEADKHPELRDYNFGSLTEIQTKFTHGRDVVLVPPQQGPPINYFIHPYVEVDGVKHEPVKYTVNFRDIPFVESEE